MSLSYPLRRIARWTWLPTLLVGGWAQAHTPGLPLALPPGAGDGVLTVATFSLAPDQGRWLDHRDGIVEALRALKPDVVALQDVQQTPEMPNQACWLAAQLDYGCSFISADPPSRPTRQGNALLTRRPVTGDAVTLLHPFEMASTAGMVRLEIGGMPVNAYVTQLHPGAAHSDDGLIRARQVVNLLRWMEVTDDGLPTVLLGDFACAQGAAELAALQAQYQEARPLASREQEGALPALPAAMENGEPRYDHILLRRDSFRLLRLAALRLPGAEGPTARGLVATVQLLRPVAAP
ncbi:endonuclease/exonuclease/phosphatase family protein [Stenotrophomonas sp. HITSZ_GD]|uniref:endonuclease/exonuclease/phosphatase family protein n=1 Tax=Stenotrophomonas sp. HITSZ_GD TaxID=3037248 RepID=UPI00240D2135|nr:endonuclease/exonuclease/phosphatase family protein [Stenotrophomonas sp. HITSZ_GD]MDG2526259.1 endonuclease/exonuclease/phosphatase family protein [Stenotrophomonas sp. HITSZ_GD]